MTDNVDVDKNQEGCIYSMRDLAKYAKCTRQAIYTAVRKGKLKAYRDDKGIWRIDMKDYQAYKGNKYHRTHCKVNGLEIYSRENGIWSPPMVLEYFQRLGGVPVSMSKIYYLIRTGRLRSTKIGHYYIVTRVGAELCWMVLNNHVQAVKRA